MKKSMSLPSPNEDSTRVIVKVKPKDIFYLTTTVETYEGIAIPRSIDQSRGIVEFLTAPDFVNDLNTILANMKKEINIDIILP